MIVTPLAFTVTATPSCALNAIVFALVRSGAADRDPLRGGGGRARRPSSEDPDCPLASAAVPAAFVPMRLP